MSQNQIKRIAAAEKRFKENLLNNFHNSSDNESDVSDEREINIQTKPRVIGQSCQDKENSRKLLIFMNIVYPHLWSIMSQNQSKRNIMSTVTFENGLGDLEDRIITPKIKKCKSLNKIAKTASLK